MECWAQSVFGNCQGCCGEGFWLGPRRRGRRISAAGCNGRSNAGPGQKTRRPEGCGLLNSIPQGWLRIVPQGGIAVSLADESRRDG